MPKGTTLERGMREVDARGNHSPSQKSQFKNIMAITVHQSRIQRMSFRFAALAVLILVSVFAVVGCGIQTQRGVGNEKVLTAELVVPPVKEEVVVEATATATPSPTATPTVAVTKEVIEEKPKTIRVSNRGYNSMGDTDAPIVMFDFSDFL